MNTYLPIFISENENNLDGIRSVLRTSCQENEKSLKILDEIYLGNKEDLSELNGALDELKKALIQSVENSENSNMDRQAVQKYFDKEIEPIRVKTDIAIQKVIDSADRRVLIIQESTDEKAEADRGVSFATRAAPPVTPPKTKLLGNLKKYTPMVMMLILRVMITYRLTICKVFSRVLISI